MKHKTIPLCMLLAGLIVPEVSGQVQVLTAPAKVTETVGKGAVEAFKASAAAVKAAAEAAKAASEVATERLSENVRSLRMEALKDSQRRLSIDALEQLVRRSEANESRARSLLRVEGWGRPNENERERMRWVEQQRRDSERRDREARQRRSEEARRIESEMRRRKPEH